MQEQWEYGSDPNNLQFYVGRLAGHKLATEEEWEKKIDQAEKLLIYAHLPVYNTQNTKTIPEDYVSDNHIFNWDAFRDLFPEVSGKRYTSKFEHIWNEKIYSYGNLKE